MFGNAYFGNHFGDTYFGPGVEIVYPTVITAFLYGLDRTTFEAEGLDVQTFDLRGRDVDKVQKEGRD